MASSAPATTVVSPEEYLALVRESESFHEYVDGRIVEVTAVSPAHSVIVANVTRALATQLRGGPCTAYSAGLRLKSLRRQQRPDYFCPDLMVVCVEAEFEGENSDILLNPRLIVEVLSPSTGDYDRGTKWENYRRLPALQDYLLVAQDEPRIERFTRHGDRFWLFSEASQLVEVLDLESIGCTLAVAEVYEKVFTDRNS